MTVITMANGLNLSELPPLLAMIQSAGVRFWQIQPNAILGRSRAASELHLSEDAYLELGAFLLEHRCKTRDGGLRFIPADSLGYFSVIDVGDPTWRGCNAGVAGCGIMSDGRIKGCLSLPDDFIEGDLRQRSLWDIWFDRASFTYARHVHMTDLGPACSACDKAEQCLGGCNSISYGATGRFHNDPYCFHGISRHRSGKGEATEITSLLCPTAVGV